MSDGATGGRDGACAVCGGATHRWAELYGRWRYAACNACGHVSLAPMPTPAELTSYYSRAYEYSDTALADSVERRYVRLVDAYRPPATDRPPTVLEHGANTGLLLEALRAGGWSVSGTELGATFRASAVGRGLDVREGLAAWAGRQFDVVVGFHVIEHVPDFAAELRTLAALVAPGGVLLLKTPNVRALPARLFPAEWQWSTPPAHVHLFSGQSLRRATEAAGLSVERLDSERGNAKPLAFELLRSGVHRVLGSAHRDEPGAGRPQTRSDRPWYRAALLPGEALSMLGAPIAPLAGRALLMPELTLVARRPA